MPKVKKKSKSSKSLESYEQTITAKFVTYDCERCIQDLTNELMRLVGSRHMISGKIFVGNRLVTGGGFRR